MSKVVLPPERVTNDPSNADARIFVGNIDLSITRTDLEKKFAKYGVLAVTVLKGYGFVQFSSPDDAQEAIDRENSTELKGRQLILKIVNQARVLRRSGRSTRAVSPPRNIGPVSRDHRQRSRPSIGDRKRSRRDDSPVWRERDNRARLNYDRSAPVTAMSEPALCELVVLSRDSRGFASEIEDMLVSEGCSVDIVVPPMGSDLNQLMDQISMRGTPHALVLHPNCEMSRMVSLNVLHKNPPEMHHNVPVQHALQILRESAVIYRSKCLAAAGAMNSAAASDMGSTGGAKLPGDICHLLDVVRADRQLTTDEYNILIRFLEDKRDYWDSGMFSQWRDGQSGPPKPVPPPMAAVSDGHCQQQNQLDLQQKILSLMQVYNKAPLMGGTLGQQDVSPRAVPPPSQQSWNSRRF